MIENIYIRVDANSKIGTGHLVRTEILADELVKNNLKLHFICKTIPEKYAEKLEKRGYRVFLIEINKS